MLGYFTWASHQKNQILVKLEMDYRQDRGIPALNYPVTFPASSVGMSQMIDFSYSGESQLVLKTNSLTKFILFLN